MFAGDLTVVVCAMVVRVTILAEFASVLFFSGELSLVVQDGGEFL